MPDLEIYKRWRFEAAHRLTGVPPSHKCSVTHGHSYEIEVRLKGPVDPQTGFVMDFADLAAACEPLRKQLDHAVLNEIEGLENPTSENLCVWLWRRLKPRAPLLSQIVVRETESAGCVYAGD